MLQTTAVISYQNTKVHDNIVNERHSESTSGNFRKERYGGERLLLIGFALDCCRSWCSEFQIIHNEASSI